MCEIRYRIVSQDYLLFGKWATPMIVLNPTGDPMDIKNMVGALSAKIPESR